MPNRDSDSLTWAELDRRLDQQERQREPQMTDQAWRAYVDKLDRQYDTRTQKDTVMPDRETQQQIDAYVKSLTAPSEEERQSLVSTVKATQTVRPELEEKVERRRGLYPT